MTLNSWHYTDIDLILIKFVVSQSFYQINNNGHIIIANWLISSFFKKIPKYFDISEIKLG